MKRVATWFTLGLIAIVLVESASWAGLAVLGRLKRVTYDPIPVALSEEQRQIVDDLIGRRHRYFTHHPDYGWSIKPWGRSPLYRANSQGIRADREFDPVPADGVVRVAAFGDSFTHADDVANPDTWEAILETLNPGLEVLNFGVSGFGPDQAFLRYRLEGIHYHPDIVLLGFMSENVMRLVSVFRPFYMPQTNLPLAKPRFELDTEHLQIIPNPLSSVDDYRELRGNEHETLARLGEHDYFFQSRYHAGPIDFLATVRLVKILGNHVTTPLRHESPLVHGMYNPDSEAFQIAEKLLDQFEIEAEANGSEAVVVLFPYINDLRDRQDGRPSAYEALIQYLEDTGYRYLDLAPTLVEMADTVPMSELFIPHYSPAANRAVAEAVKTYLVTEGLLPTG